MTMFRRIEPAVFCAFTNIKAITYGTYIGPYIAVKECSGNSEEFGVHYPINPSVIKRPDIPDPVKKLLCSAVREYILEEGRDREHLEPLCTRDKLRSRQAKGCVDNRVLYRAKFMGPIRRKETFKLSEDLKEIVYHDYV